MEQGWQWGLVVHLNGQQQRGRVRLDVGHTYPYIRQKPLMKRCNSDAL